MPCSLILINYFSKDFLFVRSYRPILQVDSLCVKIYLTVLKLPDSRWQQIVNDGYVVVCRIMNS